MDYCSGGVEGKKESMEEDGAYGRMEDSVEKYGRDLRESKDRLRAAMAELAADTAMTGSVAAGAFDLPDSGHQRSEHQYAEERRRPTLLTAVKTPKYSANDIESLTRHAYAHMPPSVQSELARDQFIRAISPVELRMQVQLLPPMVALEMATERETVNRKSVCFAAKGATTENSTAGERPAWAAEITKLIRAVSLQTTRRPPQRPRVCWGCGQPGHLAHDCTNPCQRPGNDKESA
ncbi:contactin-associatedBBS2-like 5 [Solea senegalensis]|uniref:Contactin-associatedBBS2-like 5 n=1 Tax=Solea senegalensis TaxID=28829 RepID=A0AAV6RMM1_SOLSE|nr:contactin-associatedBBS2-like 5 [Solea senegalensis]